MKDMGLIFLWAVVIFSWLGATAYDGQLRREIDQLNTRLTRVEAR
jgi:hypothetical protein